MTASRPRPEPVAPGLRPRPSDERSHLFEQARTTRRIAIVALVLAVVGVGIAATRALLPAADSCQQASWDVRPSAATIPAGYALSATQYDINRQQVTFLGPLPADQQSSQAVVYVTITCFDRGAADAVARSEQAARDAKQTVTARSDLGDGGFSATDEGGSTFLQLRHGNVVVYLAGSSDVPAADVDALASAYDRALGGDGGTIALGSAGAGSPAPSDGAAGSDVPSGDAGQSPAAPALEARLPTEVAGIALTVDSATGTDVLGQDQGSRAITAALRAEGKDVTDLSVAQAYDANQASDLTILAVSVKGLDEAKTKQIVLDSWLSASGAGIKRDTVTFGSRTLTRVDYGDGGAKDYVLAERGAIIVITTSSEDTAKAAAAALK